MKIFQQKRQALGSEAIITIAAAKQTKADPLFATAWQQIEEFEERFSRFKPTSELSLLNVHSGESMVVSTEMQHLLQTSLYYRDLTDGLFSPFILPALQKAGYIGSWPAPKSYDPQLNFENRQTGQYVIFDRNRVTLPANTAIDLGGIGKGYLLDQLADQLVKLHCKNFWISLGGDLIANGHDPDRKPWVIDIEAADGSGGVVATHSNKGVRLAVATSGVIKRKGENWHHLIDPSNGQPAQTDVLTASVGSFSATEADIYAKCLVLLGSQRCPQFLQDHHIESAVVQTQQGSIIFSDTLAEETAANA